MTQLSTNRMKNLRPGRYKPKRIPATDDLHFELASLRVQRNLLREAIEYALHPLNRLSGDKVEAQLRIALLATDKV